MKKFTSILLSLLMVISMITVGAVSVSAVDTEEAATAAETTATEQTVPEVKAEEAEENADEPALSGAQEDAEVSQAATLTGIEIVNLPYVTEYPVGSEVDLTYELSGLAVEALYSDGSSEIYDYDLDWDFFSSVKFSGANVSREVLTVQSGENTVKLAYKGKTATFVLNGVTVTGIEVLSEPDAYDFIAGVEYDITEYLYGMVVQVTFAEGETLTYYYDNDDDRSFFYNKLEYELDGEVGWYHTLNAGENVITVSYGGTSDTFTVNAIAVTSLEVITQPQPGRLYAGAYTNMYDCLTDMVIKVTYGDGTSAEYVCNDGADGAFFEETLSYYDSNGILYTYWDEIFLDPGENTFTLSLGEISCEITVFAVMVTGMEVTAAPEGYRFIAGTEYYISDYLEGLEIRIDLEDGTSETYSYNDFENGGYEFCIFNVNYRDENYSYDSFILNSGENVITAEFADVSAEFVVNAVEVTRLEVTEPPVNTVIAGGRYDFFNCLSGMAVSVEYSDGYSDVYYYDDIYDDIETSQVYSLADYSGDFIDEYLENVVFAPGDNVVTMTYGNASDDFVITAKVIESLEITGLPYNTEYYAGNWYYTTDCLYGLTVELAFADGTSQEIYFGDDYSVYDLFEISGDCIDIDGNFVPEAGENVITVSCSGASDSLVLTGLLVTDLKITKLPDKTEYIAYNSKYGYEVLQGMELELTFADGTTRTYNTVTDGEFFGSELSVFADVEEDYDYIIPYPGENLLTVSCGEASDTFTITAKEVTDIEITKLPDITEFIAGNVKLHSQYLDGMEVKLTYADGTQELYNTRDNGAFFNNELSFRSDCLFLGYFYPEAGENIIYVTCGGALTQYSFTGLEVESIEVTKQPQVQLTAGETCYIASCLEGTEITVTFTDGSTRVYAYDDTENGGSEFFYYELYFGDDNGQIVKLVPAAGENTVRVFCGGAETALTFTAAESGEKLWSDVNGDGEYNILDAAAIQLYKAKLYNGVFDESVADVNGDGVIDILDAAYIQLDLAKLL